MNEIVITAVGDIMLGSTYPTPKLPADDGAHILDAAVPYLQKGEIVFGNLEGPLCDTGATGKSGANSYAFRVPTRYGAHLKRAGFTHMSVANNHAGDFGDSGRNTTLYTLDRVGIRHSGGVGDIAVCVTKSGRRVSLIAFAPNTGCHNINDISGAKALVKARADAGDLVMVSFHGGGEGTDRQHVRRGSEAYLGENRGDLRAFARGVIESGADVVIGHGPHVVRGMELYCNRLIAYSLGNFATYGRFGLHGATALSLVLEIRLDAATGAFAGGRIHPMKQIGEGIPMRDGTGEVISVIRNLSGKDFPGSAPAIAPDGTVAARA